MTPLLNKLYVQIKDLRDDIKLSMQQFLNIIGNTLRQSYEDFESTMKTHRLHDSNVYTEPSDKLKSTNVTSKWINLMDNSKVRQQLFTDEEDSSILKIETPTSSRPINTTTVSSFLNEI